MRARRGTVADASAAGDAWRGGGAILASPMGVIPTLGARVARLAFAPDLLLSDGQAFLLDPDGNVGGWLPYRQVFTMLAAGRRHVMVGAAQIHRHGNQNISCNDWARPKAQLPGVRGALGNTVNHAVSYWVDVLKETGFALVVPDDVAVSRLPSAAELDLIRRLDPDGAREKEVS